MSCRGVCNRWKANKPVYLGRYVNGQKRCQVCEAWLNYDGNNCPCCGIKLRTKPRSRDGKEVYAKGLVIEKPIQLFSDIKKEMTIHGH